MPAPGVQPPTTSSCSGRILIFCQAIVRPPGTYGELRFLAMIPSRPRARAASKNASPSRLDVLAEPDARIGAQDVRQQPSTDLERLVEQRPAVEMEEVEHLVHEADRPGQAAVLDPLLEQREVGLTGVVERDDLAVDHRIARRAIHSGAARKSPK